MQGFPAADDQATAVATQALVEFYQRLAYELDTAIVLRRQGVKYVPVKNENAEHAPGASSCFGQRSVVTAPQVASEPDQNTF